MLIAPELATIADAGYRPFSGHQFVPSLKKRIPFGPCTIAPEFVDADGSEATATNASGLRTWRMLSHAPRSDTGR